VSNINQATELKLLMSSTKNGLFKRTWV